MPDDALARLLQHGRRQFGALLKHPDAGIFWWPQFERIARWFVAEEEARRPKIVHVHAEIGGRQTIAIAGRPFTLSCRADRIDILPDGTARIIDYKTGAAPSGKQVAAGLAPQLTLQVALLELGAFQDLRPHVTCEIAYVKLGTGDPAGKVSTLDLKQPVMDCARAHLAGLIDLLGRYAEENQAYLPRAIIEKEDDVLDYDHLSRVREWALSGDGR
jgi:ATP-dependent helicase/nuclease subunit B